MGSLRTSHGDIGYLNEDTGDIIWGHWGHCMGSLRISHGDIGYLNGNIEDIVWGH